tara:strand:+ start:741 stop:959 length:219 start_codon:yes stop_codon:yes gene_type:complete
LFKFELKILPVKDPVIKLIPTIKLIGKFIVSLIIKFTLVLLELFCIPTIKNKNKEKLNVIEKNNFLTGNGIY